VRKRIFGDLPDEVATLTAISFTVALGFGVVIPVLPVFTRSFGVSSVQVGFVISAFGIMRFVSALMGGRLTDRFGERTILSVGIIIVALSSALAGLSQNYGQLLLFRSLGGIGSAMFTVAAASVLLRIVPDNQRGQATSIYQGGFLVGGIVGPAVGGVLTAISLRAPFFVYAVALLLAGTYAMVRLAHVHLANADGSSPKEWGEQEQMTLRQALRLEPYVTALIIFFASGWAFYGTRAAITPLFVVEYLKAAPWWTGAGFALAGFLQAMLLIHAGRLADRKGRRRALIIGWTLGTSSLLMISFAENLVVYMLSMAIGGIGGAYFASPAVALVGDVIQGRAGRVVAFYQMAGDFGFIIGPIVAGLIIDFAGFRESFLVATVVMLPVIFFIYRLPETRRVGTSPDPGAS
jgi:MFS family permease